MVFFVRLGEAQIEYWRRSRLQEQVNNRRRATRGEEEVEGDESPRGGCSAGHNRSKDS